jgi:flagellar biosynthesis chaperone FliJ
MDIDQLTEAKIEFERSKLVFEELEEKLKTTEEARNQIREQLRKAADTMKTARAWLHNVVESDDEPV